MYSKYRRFVNSLHIVGDIISKISTNRVINLHVALLFTCLFYGFIICVIITVCMFMGISLYMLHICGYCYFSMKSYITECTCLFMFICNASAKSVVCICLSCMQFEEKIYVA